MLSILVITQLRRIGKINLDGEKQISDISKINLYELKIEILEGRNQLFSVNGKSKLLIIYDSSFLKDQVLIRPTSTNAYINWIYETLY